MKFHFIRPHIGEYKDRDGYWDARKGLEMSFNTEFLYLETDGDLPSYLKLVILGFGVGISWNHSQDWY